MKIKGSILVIVSFVICNYAHAKCPEGLSVEKAAECIKVEGSGQSYESYLQEMKELSTEIASNQTRSAQKIPAKHIMGRDAASK